MPFVAHDVSLELARVLQPTLAMIRLRDRKLASQLQRAMQSIVLNLAEGRGRFGGDRRHHYRIAYGSVREVKAALELAVIGGAVAETPSAAAVAHRLGGLLWPLVR